MDRRKVLASIGLLISCGCSGTDVPKDTEGDRGVSENATGLNTSRKKTTDRVDSIWVENYDHSSHKVNITVIGDEEEQIYNQKYQIPGKTGFEVPAVGQNGSEYEIVAEINGSITQSFDWDVKRCERGETDTSGGNTDAGVMISENEMRVARTECDVASFGMQNIDYGNHTEFSIDDDKSEEA
ncbi:hypothetical protein [Natrinema salaciae]|nr:hypothetical protein [Natrinema salaciae]